jgi:hypothetical protein
LPRAKCSGFDTLNEKKTKTKKGLASYELDPFNRKKYFKLTQFIKCSPSFYFDQGRFWKLRSYRHQKKKFVTRRED